MLLTRREVPGPSAPHPVLAHLPHRAGVRFLDLLVYATGKEFETCDAAQRPACSLQLPPQAWARSRLEGPEACEALAHSTMLAEL